MTTVSLIIGKQSSVQETHQVITLFRLSVVECFSASPIFDLSPSPPLTHLPHFAGPKFDNGCMRSYDCVMSRGRGEVSASIYLRNINSKLRSKPGLLSSLNFRLELNRHDKDASKEPWRFCADLFQEYFVFWLSINLLYFAVKWVRGLIC